MPNLNEGTLLYADTLPGISDQGPANCADPGQDHPVVPIGLVYCKCRTRGDRDRPAPSPDV